jgi:hypothetical protein
MGRVLRRLNAAQYGRRPIAPYIFLNMPDSAYLRPTPPPNRPHSSLQDVQAHFAELTAKTPVDEASREAFIHSKLLLAHTHPTFDLASRDIAVNGLIDRLGADARRAFSQLTQPGLQEANAPVPGGVGYGLFYENGFKAGWGRGTALAFDIVCPTPPGGNVNTHLYLTATNRSGMGVEAFVSYDGQDDTHFRVFDWGRDDHWQTDIPLAGLTNYLKAEVAHGQSYQVLPVWNGTSLVGGSNWRNQVLLYNHARAGWDLVYQYDYSATDAQQKTGWVGSWAPIVETFQSTYTQTEPMGALATQLVGTDAEGEWGNWALLGAPQASVRTDNVGFHLVFLDPNYAFTVRS